VVRYNAIYGSFAVLPLFLVWLQLSWLIVLYGAELSFAYQNVDTYEFEPDALQASQRLKTLIALQITHRLVKNFQSGAPPLTAYQISHQLEIPIRFVNELLFGLVKSNILSVAETEKGAERGYQPAVDINALTIQRVIEALEKRGINALSYPPAREFSLLAESLETFGEAIALLPANRLLKEL